MIIIVFWIFVSVPISGVPVPSDQQVVTSYIDTMLMERAKGRQASARDSLISMSGKMVVPELSRRLLEDPSLSQSPYLSYAFRVLEAHDAAQTDVGYRALIWGLEHGRSRRNILLSLARVPDSRREDAVEEIAEWLRGFSLAEIQSVPTTRFDSAQLRTTQSERRFAVRILGTMGQAGRGSIPLLHQFVTDSSFENEFRATAAASMFSILGPYEFFRQIGPPDSLGVADSQGLDGWQLIWYAIQKAGGPQIDFMDSLDVLNRQAYLEYVTSALERGLRSPSTDERAGYFYRAAALVSTMARYHPGTDSTLNKWWTHILEDIARNDKSPLIRQLASDSLSAFKAREQED